MKKNLLAVIRIIKQLSYILTRKQKAQSIKVFFTMILLSCLELLGVSAIYPLLLVMSSPQQIREKSYLAWLYRIKPAISYEEVVVVICSFAIIVFLIKNALAVFFIYQQYKFAASFQREAATDMLRKYMRRPYEYFINTNSSIIIRGISSDTTSVYMIILNSFQLAGELLTVIMISVFLVLLDVTVALCALALASICFLIILRGFKGRMKKTGRLAREAMAEQSQCSYQAITGFKEILVLDRKDYFTKQFEKAATKLNHCNLINGVVTACPDRILEGVCLSGFLAIACIRIVIGGDVASFLPVLGSFAMGAFKMLPSISKLTTRINAIVYQQFGLYSCYENYKEAARIEEEERLNGVEQVEETKEFNYDSSVSFQDAVEIRDVAWKYRNSSTDVLSGLSLQIKKGEAVAFVGPSGAGKTTLADIIMGLLKPQSGQILMDGQDIFLIPHTWHKQIGYVPQTVFLIDDTIRANIAFGLPENLISDEKIWDSLEQAQFKSFVENLPDGLDTMVGERGVKFSGGQRQRIALARALYENPEILVLDEATSALDSETEAAVMESIERLQGHKTLIIIAHRLTTIKNCDKIYKIEEGVAEETTYEKLTHGG